MLKLISPVIKKFPVLGQLYGFTNTAMKVYNTTSVLEAVSTAIVSIVKDCIPPQVRYPVKCAILIAQTGVAIVTGRNTWAVEMVIAAGRQRILDE